MSADRIDEVLRTEPSLVEPTRPATALPGRGELVIRRATFGYPGAAEPVLREVDLTSRPGEVTAVVGSTGSGETTLVRLVPRLYGVEAGSVTIDGVDVRHMDRGLLTATVSRSGATSPTTCASAIPAPATPSCGERSRPPLRADQPLIDGLSLTVEPGQTVAAAEAVHADHFVRTLPDGYDTVLDEDGANLSAGERQLLTIARAFLVEPSILVLDEATSSVDTRTEMLIQQGMARLRHGRSSFIIAHRLSTIRDADVILVMESGRIVEQGPHDELVAAGGTYARLHAAHLARPVPA